MSGTGVEENFREAAEILFSDVTPTVEEQSDENPPVELQIGDRMWVGLFNLYSISKMPFDTEEPYFMAIFSAFTSMRTFFVGICYNRLHWYL